MPMLSMKTKNPMKPMLEILTDQQHPRFHAYILLRMLPATRWSLNHWPCS
jgi:hypothetical protein